MTDPTLVALLERIATALERAAPSSAPAIDLSAADAFVWHADGRLAPVPRVNRVDIALLRGVERQRDILLDNTRRFAAGFPANNALLWGARGMGKSSLVKSVHAAVNAGHPGALARSRLERLPRHPRRLCRGQRACPVVSADGPRRLRGRSRCLGRHLASVGGLVRALAGGSAAGHGPTARGCPWHTPAPHAPLAVSVRPPSRGFRRCRRRGCR